ncbi:glycosyltransferase family 2 protein, partial [Schleiferiaceae bacterium]|nr:glycosyltransferase family 2 protein [Schleiferiaceae bacterium]
MKLSVIIPAYNAAATLGEALCSVEQQHVQPFEVVVVNDGSTDETAAVIQSFMDRLPLVCVDQANAGLGAARNAGMRAAKGDAWAFLDADDVWGSNKLAHARDYLMRFPDVQWFYT